MEGQNASPGQVITRHLHRVTYPAGTTELARRALGTFFDVGALTVQIANPIVLALSY